MSVASRSEALSTKEIEELLDGVDQTLERLKTLYEQYFMGIQKQAPGFIHNDVERKLRDLTQLNVRNTGLRYRLATLQQKFGSYNSYWRRTLRQIENGTYIRQLAKVGRDAAKTGADIPEEILAAMPKRMREQVLRDRDNAIAIAKRRHQVAEEADGMMPPGADDVAAMINEPSVLKRELKTQTGAHILEDDGDLDFDQLFAAFQDDAPEPAPSPAPAAPPKRDPAPSHASVQPASTQQITMPVPRFAKPAPTGNVPASEAPTVAMPKMPTPAPGAPTGPMPVVTPPTATSVIPRVPSDTAQQTTAIPRVPAPPGSGATRAPSQQIRPNPIAPGSAAAAGDKPVESMSGPFPRTPTPPAGTPPPRPTSPPGARAPTPPPGGRMPTPPPGGRMPTPPPGGRMPTPPPGGRMPTPPPGALKPPPGMTEADVNALHAKYVQAKQAIGEKVDATSRDKLLRTINQTAPKVMEQYKSAGVDFTVVVKDNQVVIKAKPKG